MFYYRFILKTITDNTATIHGLKYEVMSSFVFDSGFRYRKCFTTGSYFAINILEIIPYHLCFYSLRKP